MLDSVWHRLGSDAAHTFPLLHFVTSLSSQFPPTRKDSAPFFPVQFNRDCGPTETVKVLLEACFVFPFPRVILFTLDGPTPIFLVLYTHFFPFLFFNFFTLYPRGIERAPETLPGINSRTLQDKMTVARQFFTFLCAATITGFSCKPGKYSLISVPV